MRTTLCSLFILGGLFACPLHGAIEIPTLVSPFLAQASGAPASGEEGGGIDSLAIVLGLLGGLVVFLFGVEQLSRALKEVAGEKMETWLARFTRNPLAGVGTGTVATAALDSSSVVIIMTITLVNAGLLTFQQSLGVVLGANIGTTLGGQIVAFDIVKYSPVVLVFGLLLHFFGRSPRAKQWGLVALGAGLVFFALHYLGDVMAPFEKHQPFIDLMKAAAADPIRGALLGAAFTALIQSSSGTMGIVIVLASGGLIPLEAGVHIMLGAEIGTCLDTLVATLGRSRHAVRTGVFHLLFNIVTVSIGLMLAPQIAAAGEWLAFGSDNVGRKIANAHVLFNTAGALLTVPFLPWIGRSLERVFLPSRAPVGRLQPA